ncbi:MAG: hypothetical protein DMG13_25350 [Acidobacteria bacterium]|nr:MAG: hypothetical protein DMG13_25350 [Acidobacteriota bacterium]
MSLFEGHVSITNRRVLFWGFIFLTLSGSLMAAFFMQTSNESVAFDELLVKFAAGTPLSRVKEVSNRIGLTVIEQMAVYDPDLYRVQVPANVKVDEAIEQYGQNSEVIGARKIERELLVKFAAGTPLSRVEEVSNRIGSTVLEQMAVGDPDLYRVQVPANVKVDEAIEQYAQNSEVIRATKIPPIWINEVEALFVPDEFGR